MVAGPHQPVDAEHRHHRPAENAGEQHPATTAGAALVQAEQPGEGAADGPVDEEADQAPADEDGHDQHAGGEDGTLHVEPFDGP